MSVIEIDGQEALLYAQEIQSGLVSSGEILPIGYDPNNLEAINTNLGTPEHLEPEHYEAIEQLGQRQMLFTKAIAHFAMLVERSETAPFWLKRLVNYGLEEGDIQGSSPQAVKILKQLNERAITAGAYSVFGRLDMIEGKGSILNLNEDGIQGIENVTRVSEVQTAMGGMGTAAAIQEAMNIANGEEDKTNQVIEAFRETYSEEANGVGRLAFHIGRGLESYTGEFIALAKLWEKHTGHGATLVIDDSNYSEVQINEFKEQINQQGIAVLWSREAVEDDYKEITALYRISDTARLTSTESIPLLKRLAKLDPQKIQPPIIPALDRTQLMQALIRSGDSIWYEMGNLWEEAFMQAISGTPFNVETILDEIKSDFPEIEIVREYFEIEDILAFKRDKRYSRPIFDPSLGTISAGTAQDRGTSLTQYTGIISQAKAAFKELRETTSETDSIYVRNLLAGLRLVAKVIDMPKESISVVNPQGEVEKFEGARRRRNPFMYWPVGTPMAKVFALVSYMKKTGGSGQGGWKVTGAPGENGAITPHTY